MNIELHEDMRFDETEQEQARVILSELEGMSILDALTFLDRCKTALVNFGFFRTPPTESGSALKEGR